METWVGDGKLLRRGCWWSFGGNKVDVKALWAPFRTDMFESVEKE